MFGTVPALRSGMKNAAPRPGHGSWRDAYRREVHEPALRLHESLDLRAHPARCYVVRDIEKRRVIDGSRMRLSQRGIPLRRIERLARLGHQLVELRIVDKTPIVRYRR